MRPKIKKEKWNVPGTRSAAIEAHDEEQDEESDENLGTCIYFVHTCVHII